MFVTVTVLLTIDNVPERYSPAPAVAKLNILLTVPR
jgi:hypothetical protein